MEWEEATMWVAGRGELKGQLVVVTGPSGCGKTTVIRRALEHPEMKSLQLSVSATTRPRRPGEQEGVAYHFMSVAEFEAARDRDFLEWAEYNGHYYGTPAKPVLDALAGGKSVLLEIEVKGALQIRAAAPSAFFVFFRAPAFRVLEQRLRARGTEDDATIHRRLKKAREELAEAHWYDVQLVNDDLDRCTLEFITVLRLNGCGG
jgi:guanylate kinase